MYRNAFLPPELPAVGTEAQNRTVQARHGRVHPDAGDKISSRPQCIAKRFYKFKRKIQPFPSPGKAKGIRLNVQSGHFNLVKHAEGKPVLSVPVGTKREPNTGICRVGSRIFFTGGQAARVGIKLGLDLRRAAPEIPESVNAGKGQTGFQGITMNGESLAILACQAELKGSETGFRRSKVQFELIATGVKRSVMPTPCT